MKRAIPSLLALAALAAGCANLPRSRDLANPDVSGQTLAEQVCSNCHGVTGTATSPNVPNLAGQLDPYLVKQLKEFKSHSRSDPVGNSCCRLRRPTAENSPGRPTGRRL